MILACAGCDGRYDVSGYDLGQQFRCRCGVITTLVAPSPQAGQLACPHCGAGVAPTVKSCAFCQAELLLKACPRCLSRVFHGHKHCPECGTELGVAAHDGVHADRACPRCDTSLHPRKVGDFVVDECATCLGLFLDHVAVERVVTDRQQARAEALLGSLPASARPLVVPPGQRMYVKCPMCRTVMNRKLFSTGSGVVIDICRAHGVFFDVGELPRIIAFVMTGGVERAQKKDVARLRDEARQHAQSAQFTALMASRSSTRVVGHEAGNGGALVELLFSLFS
ncbi:MAG: zf-TFIIB domain-containing protein [Proteobacteria bacterium]|nr:zf-TFIIB domain-containing protein [Pseudomonadota bacterium]